ncbi:MAG: adenylate/guanylate cyclase domain-containing protein [Candidatus Limnocylindrales bacterium]
MDTPAPAMTGPALDRAALPTGTITFLFTDIEGSTRLAERLGTAAWSSLLEAQQTLLRAAFRASNGFEIKTEGDSFFVVFRSAPAAVAATVAAQRGLAAHTWPADAPVRVRMGLHTGEGVLVPDGDYVGIDVHRAARVAAAGHGGQVLVSSTTRGLVDSSLAPDVSIRDLGEHRLKDLSRPEQIGQLVIAGLPDQFPPLKTLTNLPNNLPLMLTSFVGREKEVAAARALLATTRLLTLTGPGGTGKTRLALQLAAEAIDDFPDGVYFVPLEPITDATLVPETIASTLGLPDTGSVPIAERLQAHLAGRRMLLVLDNFEQVTDAGPLVADLLKGAPGLRCIATSRAALRVYGEQEFPVPPLGLPDPAHLPPLEALTQYEAVALFITRARTMRPDFAVDNANAPAVAEICARLDGLPLAIELAAARIKLLSPQDMLPRLTSRLALLGGSGARNLPARQQTLRGAIAWSYDLLDEAGRRLLRRLSVFVGGFALEAAEAVCGPAAEGAPDSSIDVLETVAALVDQSLLRQSDLQTHTRFVMLETIREFAMEALEECGERPEIRRRHATYFMDFAERAAPLLTAEDRATWLDWLEHEHDNLRAAIAWAIEVADPVVGSRLGAALWRFWQTRGHLREGQRRLAAILAIAGCTDHPVERMHALEAAGGVAYWLGEMDSGAGYYEEALAIARERGVPAEIAQALFNLSFTMIMPRSDVQRGEALVNESLAIFRELGDEAGILRAIWARGTVQIFREDWAAAARDNREALVIARKLHDAYWTSWSLHMLGASETELGDLAMAREHLDEALDLLESSGEITGIVLALDDFAKWWAKSGDPPRAVRLAAAARKLQAQTEAFLATFSVEMFGLDATMLELEDADTERYAAEGGALTVEQAVALARGGEFPARSAGMAAEAPN